MSLLTPMSPELAVLLFPAMSMLSVGGILLLLTNMQVSPPSTLTPTRGLGQPAQCWGVPNVRGGVGCPSAPGGQPLWEVPLHHHHPLQRSLRLLVCHLPHHQGGDRVADVVVPGGWCPQGPVPGSGTAGRAGDRVGNIWVTAGATARDTLGATVEPPLGPCVGTQLWPRRGGVWPAWAGGSACCRPRPQVLYEHGLSLRAMFLFMAACSAWHLLRTFFLMPRTHIPYPLPPAYDYG